MVRGVAGTWKDLTDSVNSMASNLTGQVRNIAEVATAVARGDLSRKITVDVRGEILELKDTLNTMVDQLNAFAAEVTRVAREVGTEGKLGGQAQVPGVAGTWKDLTDSVNSMAGNLTAQVRNIVEVTIAVANGDLSKKITVDVRGEILQLKETLNTMVDQLNRFAGEVTRVAREVGTEGRLGGQANVPGVAGTWKDLTDSVNSMAGNLTAQVRNIAEVTTAVARGDLSRKITVDVKGEILELKNTINTMVDQLNAFASEVTRVAREVGTEGKLGGQAQVPGVAGTWKDLTDNVNFMASNLTAQVRNIAEVATAIASGDLSKKITVDVRGEILLLKETLNTMVEQLRSFAAEVTRVAREVGTDGRLGGQAVVPGVAGTWKDLTDNVNLLAANLTTQVRNIAEVTTAVARGDLSRKITVDVKGEILELKNTINTMVDQLNGFASEVTRVAREVGTEGQLGGQAQVPGVAGTWKDLTDTVNVMAANLTEQVRGIVKVVTAVANGDLKQNLAVKSKGEVAALGRNHQQHDRHARDLRRSGHDRGARGRRRRPPGRPGERARRGRHVEGPHRQRQPAGGQPDHPGARHRRSGDRGDQGRPDALDPGRSARRSGRAQRQHQHDDRQSAAHHRPQHRAGLAQDQPGEVHQHAAGPARPDHRRPAAALRVDAAGERPPGRDLSDGERGEAGAEAAVGLRRRRRQRPSRRRLRLGEGLIGQCAVDKRRMLITEMPDDAVPISSALFKVKPRNNIVLPVLFESQVKAVIELASVNEFTALQTMFLEQLTTSIGIVLNSIEATMQTEGLLKQSQQLAGELQAQQRELQQTNEQLEQKAQQLAERNVEVERKNQEIEQARRALEEKATELALTSKYKSEFLANMSHELRTPLNSILILGQQLTENPEGNLTGKQVEFARTIHGAGTDLLNLISDILDLSKIESGTVTVDAEEIFFSNLVDMVARPFRHEAETRQLSFDVHVDPNLGRSISTDSKRLQQVLKNLLSNAFKFTGQGGVRLNVSAALGGWSAGHPVLGQASGVVAFEVSDTGIGIPLEKQKIIFEAFQQADASTSRKYGGTGLGLAISRELASLLGGEIHLRSATNSGSTFTLYLPIKYVGSSTVPRPAAMGAVPAPVVSVERAVEQIPDDRLDVQPGDAILLIVEDDPHYARILLDLARDKGFKVLLALRGDDALDLAKQYQPTAVSLDVFLPDMLGWNVLSQLKQNPLTRHIPVQIVTLDEDRQHGLARGAFSFVTKPTTREGISEALTKIKDFSQPRRRRLLVVEDNKAEQLSIHELLGHDDIEIVSAATGKEALDILHHEACDCVVLDLRLPDMTGFEVLEYMRGEQALADVPVVVFTGRELSANEDAQLHTMARSIVVKGVESPERLLDETALFLHRVFANLPAEKQRMLERLNSSDEDLVGRTVLLVDDDARNIFALSSVLERRGMQVLTATTGSEAIELIERTPELAIVLMDIMMPEMDGYQTIENIRGNPAYRRLPIIALTAKAMKGDREKCLEAGASDYLAKPVNTEQLLSALRMWLHR